MATTTRKTTPRSSTTRASTARRSKPAPTPAEAPEIAQEAAPLPAADAPEQGEVPELRRGELIDRVVEQTGIRKKFAKPVVEEVLAILGEELAAGRRMNLQPLGRIKVSRQDELENGRLIVARIRQALRAADEEDATDGEDPLADAAE
ncbi:HU family DNA-binding protein [Mesobacterium pallidum]|uniref:HU family DNA-binding protein n=1 Tax=Mesobacterium pallidum TaxID=2872037 RepID=UPI001EE1D37A|nr:HU family DNA-binding protein [Mesobacterium pallidum]